MKCKDFTKNLLDYLEHQLDETKMKQFEKHLKECQLCNEEFMLYQKLENTFSYIEEIEPESNYKDKFWNHVNYNKPKLTVLFFKKHMYAVAASIIIIIALFISLPKIFINQNPNIQLTAQDEQDIQFLNEIQNLMDSPPIENAPAIILTDEELKALQSNEHDNNVNLDPNKKVYLRKIKEVNYV